MNGNKSKSHKNFLPRLPFPEILPVGIVMRVIAEGMSFCKIENG
jgi:hypothetical protein